MPVDQKMSGLPQYIRQVKIFCRFTQLFFPVNVCCLWFIRIAAMEEELFFEQLALELSAIEEMKTEYERKVKEGRLLPPHFALISKGLAPLSRAIQEYQQSRTSGRQNGRIRVELSETDPQELAFVTLWSVITGLGDGLNATKSAIMVGREIEDHLEYNSFKSVAPRFAKAIAKKVKTQSPARSRATMTRAKKRIGVKELNWDDRKRFHVGTKMLAPLIHSTGLFEMVPGKTETGFRCKLIRPTEATLKYIEAANARCAISSPRYKPCIIPPKPWTNLYDGGFHSRIGHMKLCLVKSRQKEVRETLENTPMPHVYAAVNALQQTAWRVNRNVFQVVELVWATPDGLGVLPKPVSIDLYAKPEKSHTEFAQISRTRLRSKFKLASDILARAREFQHYDRFYYCWQLDFRGRCYPVQPYLQPQGGDLCKGLLEFGDPVPLGEHGANWLAIHGANVYGNGLDKRPFSERADWVNQHEAQILHTAKNPLDELEFWSEAEEQWQFLAFCFEWSAYLKEGRCESHVSRLPVAEDGTCNGLQHVSFLMMDQKLAQAVNVVPRERPQDIYQTVADNVARLVEADRHNDTSTVQVTDEDGNEIAATSNKMAEIWHGHIDRSLIKLNVMTLSYGVTDAGMRGQILDEVYNRFEKSPESLGKLAKANRKELFKLAVYLVDQVHKAINQVAESAQILMKWSKIHAASLGKKGKYITWQTPSGFRVVQRYVKRDICAINTYWGKQRIKLAMAQDTDELDVRKQIAGIMPNLIHSFDAAHLTMIVNFCQEAGITSFAMIHDSFGTHAGRMETMYQSIALAFKHIYTFGVLDKITFRWFMQMAFDSLLPWEDPMMEKMATVFLRRELNKLKIPVD
jgi:DNA-directed RNA polymerase, mitochondrial